MQRRHGKNSTSRAILHSFVSRSLQINKRVGGKILKKRIHVRIEHVRPSRCREDFLARVQANDEKKRAAKAANQKISTKRIMPGPRGAFSITNAKMETVTPIPYDIVKVRPSETAVGWMNVQCWCCCELTIEKVLIIVPVLFAFLYPFQTNRRVCSRK